MSYQAVLSLIFLCLKLLFCLFQFDLGFGLLFQKIEGVPKQPSGPIFEQYEVLFSVTAHMNVIHFFGIIKLYYSLDMTLL